MIQETPKIGDTFQEVIARILTAPGFKATKSAEVTVTLSNGAVGVFKFTLESIDYSAVDKPKH